MHEKAFTRRGMISEKYPDPFGLLGSLTQIQCDYDSVLLKFSDIDERYGNAISFAWFYMVSAGMFDSNVLFKETFHDARSAYRFAVKIGNEKLTDYFARFISEIDKMPQDLVSEISREDIDNVAMGKCTDPRIPLSLPSMLYNVICVLQDDWKKCKDIVRSAQEIARDECDVIGVDNDSYYEWLAQRINLIEDYDERIRSTKPFGWMYGRSQLGELGHRFLRSSLFPGWGKSIIDLSVAHSTRGQQFVLASYRDATQVLNSDMTEVLGEWRSNLPRATLALSRGLAHREWIDAIPHWRYVPEEGRVIKLSLN